MVRSQSRSPRWRHRSKSPGQRRSPVQNRHRPPPIPYGDNKRLKKYSGPTMEWSIEAGKFFGQTSSRGRGRGRGRGHHRFFEHKAPFPNARRTPEFLRSPPPRKVPFPIREGNRGFSSPPRFVGGAPPRSPERLHFQNRMHEKYMNEHFRDGRPIDPFHGPPHIKHEDRHRNDYVLEHRRPQEKYFRSPRRYSNEFRGRRPYQERYPVHHDLRERDHSAERFREMQHHEAREPLRNFKWKTESPIQRREGSRQVPHRSSRQDKYSERLSGTKKKFVSNQKRTKSSLSNRHDLLDGKRQSLERHGIKSGSSNNKSAGSYVSKKQKHSPEKKSTVSPKPTSSKKHSSSETYKSDMDLKTAKLVQKKKRSSSANASTSQTPYEEKPKTADFTASVKSNQEVIKVKVDMKKTLDECRTVPSSDADRQLSQDLVATNKKRENFHPVFDHLGSTTQTTRSAPTGEFTQEIITLVHQVKENYFKPSKLSLHERFSQLEDENKKSDVEKDTGPEIHRRIDISLTELQSKKTQKSDSTKATSSGGTIDDPNDLRHDIERRRKERLHDDDGHPGRRKPDKHEAERNKRDSSSRPDDHVAEGSRKVAKGSRRPAPFLKRPVRRIAPLKKIIRKPFTNAFRPGEPNSKPYPPPRKPFGEVRGKLPKFRKPFQAKLRPRFPPLKPPFSRKRPFEGHPEGPTSRPAFLRKRPFENMHDGPPPFKRFFKDRSYAGDRMSESAFSHKRPLEEHMRNFAVRRPFQHNLRPQRLIGRPVSHIVKQSFNIQSKYWRLRGDHSRGRGSRIFRGGFERKEGVFAIRREPQ